MVLVVIKTVVMKLTNVTASLSIVFDDFLKGFLRLDARFFCKLEVRGNSSS